MWHPQLKSKYNITLTMLVEIKSNEQLSIDIL